MRVKTRELSDATLDWVVATIEGMTNLRLSENTGKPIVDVPEWGAMSLADLAFSSNWELAGQIISRENIDIRRNWPELDRTGTLQGRSWFSERLNPDYVIHFGSTPLIAAMRCFVATKLGNEVEVPEAILELLSKYQIIDVPAEGNI